MSHRRFDALIMGLVERPRPRNTAFRLVAGAVLAGLLARVGLGEPGAAAAGCRKVGKPCQHARQCCSGICTGRHGNKTCRGHGAGTCKREQDSCTAPGTITCNHDDLCACLLTTAGTSFCAARFGGPAGSVCADCQRDADCVAQGLPPGTACGRLSAGFCPLVCAQGTTACLVPCHTQPAAR